MRAAWQHGRYNWISEMITKVGDGKEILGSEKRWLEVPRLEQGNHEGGC